MVNTHTSQSFGSGPQAQGAPPPPKLATLVVQQVELIRLLTEERQGQGQQQPWEHCPRSVSYQDFEGLRPPIFTSCSEPLAVDDWLRTIESKFTLLRELTEQEKARYVAQILQGPVGAWHATFLTRQERDHVPTRQEFCDTPYLKPRLSALIMSLYAFLEFLELKV